MGYGVCTGKWSKSVTCGCRKADKDDDKFPPQRFNGKTIKDNRQVATHTMHIIDQTKID